ncbi:tubulin polymerization-promoting protein homolog [Calliopsis andreniformis]|uniref:tubulin polymerization-promoting protein homolog n=1 Tax=Calliopsis andreniformis TaxID=337506 RepID=UPI003FCEE24F
MEDLLPRKKEPEVIPFKEMFEAYCQMDPISSKQSVHLLPLSQSDKWLISARILDMVTFTTTDTGLAFFKFRKRALSYDEYLIYLENLAVAKNVDFEEIKYKMQICGKPRKTT